MSQNCDFRRLVLLHLSNLSWMDDDLVPMKSKIKGLDYEVLCLPDSAKWNRFSNSPYLHFLFRERYYKSLVQEIKKDGIKRKVILMLHKKSLLMPVLGVARTLLRAKAVDNSTLRVLIMNLNGKISMDKPVSTLEVSRACLKYGISESIIADSKFDPRINPDQEIFRFFSSF